MKNITLRKYNIYDGVECWNVVTPEGKELNYSKTYPKDFIESIITNMIEKGYAEIVWVK